MVLTAGAFPSFDLDSFSVPKELVLHFVAFLAGVTVLFTVPSFRPRRVDVWLVLFVGLGTASALLATNGWLAGRALAVSVSGIVLFGAARGLRAVGLARPLRAALALMVVLAAAVALAEAYGLRLPVFAENRVPGGTLGNRNSVGHLAAMGLPMVVLVAAGSRKAAGVLPGLLGTAVVVAALVLTRSRAAWLGTGAVLAVLLLGVLAVVVRFRAWRLLGRFALAGVLGAAGAVAAVTLPNTLRWNSADPYAETAQRVLNYREGSGHGRLVQYRTSLRLLGSNPVLGVGPGNWPVAYPAYALARDPSMGPEAGQTMNPWPSSDLVALLVERGPPALLIWLLVVAGLARGAWRGFRHAAEADEALGAVALFAVLTGTLVVGALDAVLLLAWPAYFFWTAAGVLWPEEHGAEIRASVGVRCVVLGLLVLGAAAGFVRSAGQLGAMALYDFRSGRTDLETAARLDPGNYRVRVRLGQAGSRAERCEHAVAARDLFPHAALAQRLARRCP